MNVRKWQHPKTGEARYYIDTRFPSGWMSREADRYIDGRWIAADAQGIARIYGGRGKGVRTEDGPWLDAAFFGSEPMSFARWEELYASCLTKGGNFSVSKWMKLEEAA